MSMLTSSASRDWHTTFRQWSKPPSETDDQKAANAVSMIRDAIRCVDGLSKRSVGIYATGSYRNNTNARTESDVDVAVVLNDIFFYDSLPAGLTPAVLGFSDSSYSFATFRVEVESALKAKFGRGVSVGDKAFDVHENTYRLDADVACFVKHRRYTGRLNKDGSWHYHEGVEMRPRGNPSTRIVNWHQHHYDQGVAKNDTTGGRFKRITRILKRLRTHMIEEGSASSRAAATPIASFFLECLAYNVPVDRFNQSTDGYYDDVKHTLIWLWNRLKKAEHVDMKEVSGMKWLFRSGQHWTPDQAKTFIEAAWKHVGFSNL